MKEKIFIVVYIDGRDTTTYIVSAKTPKGAMRNAYRTHNPEYGNVDDDMNKSIEDDFYVNSNIIATIKNANIKDVKVF